MSIIRTVFLGTPDIAEFSLKSLIDDEHFSIVGVITQPDRPAGRNMRQQSSPVKKLALAHSLPVLTPESLKDSTVLEQIKGWRAETAVVVAFGQMLPQAFLDMFPKKVVNVHASLLPRWRGAAPIQRAIMAGDKETGVSLQVVVKKLDAGDVLGVRKLPILEETDALQLLEQMKPLAAQLLCVDLMDYLRGNLTPSAQDESQVTYAHKIEKSEALIDWKLTAQQIHNNIRGLKMGPGSYTFRQGKKLKVIRSAVSKELGNPGEVLAVGGESLKVACGSGSLEIFELQPESKAPMKLANYLRGNPIQPGEIWGE